MTLSIIIPVYLTEEYNYQNFEKLITELLRQKKQYPDTEIICIDDGSPMHFDYPEGAVVFRKDNAGCANARNDGLRLATGDWITFADCDDVITPNYLETIHHYLDDRYKYISWDWKFNNGNPSRQYTPGYRNNAVWAYAFRRDIIGDKKFDPTIRDGSDDIDFVKRVINPESMWHKDLPDVLYLYNWYGNENSILHRVLRGEEI